MWDEMLGCLDDSALVPAERARSILRTGHDTLKRLVQEGKVQGRVVTRGRQKVFVAPLAEWRRGLEAYRKARGLWVPPGWITMNEAAKRLSVGPTPLANAVRAGIIRVHVVHRESGPAYYAPHEEWAEGLRRWQARRKRSGGARPATMPEPRVSAEEARRRLASMTHEQRLRLRVTILAVMRGYGLPAWWRREDHAQGRRAG